MKSEKQKFTKTEKRVICIMSIAIISALSVFAWLAYANDYYKATNTAKKAMLGTATIDVVEEDGYYLFAKNAFSSYIGKGEGKGIVFYPGGIVDEKA